MPVDEVAQGERYGTALPLTIRVLETATRNDDGSIHVIPADLSAANIPQQRPGTTRTLPEINHIDSIQQPLHRLPFKMITSSIAYRKDDGIPTSIPLQAHRKRVSALDELFTYPPNAGSKQCRLDLLTHPKHIGKPHKQPSSGNKTLGLKSNTAFSGNDNIGEMRKYYSSLYGNQNKVDKPNPQIYGAFRSFVKEPFSSVNPNCSTYAIEPKRSNGFNNTISRNHPIVTNNVTSSHCRTPLTSGCANQREKYNLSSLSTHYTNVVSHNKHLNENTNVISGIVDSPVGRNVDTLTSQKEHSTANGWSNDIEEASVSQHEYSHECRNSHKYSSKLKQVKAHTSQMFERKVTKPVSPIREVDTIYSSSKMFIKTENWQNKELEKGRLFHWGPKLDTSDNESDKKLDVFMKEQSTVRYDVNAFSKNGHARRTAQSDNRFKTNQMITNVNYQITEFSVSLVPEDEREKTNEGTVEEYHTESVSSDSDQSDNWSEDNDHRPHAANS